MNSKVRRLEERVEAIDHSDSWDSALTTKEANSVREFWIQLHWTPEERAEYFNCHERMEAISAAAGSCYLNTEQNRAYMQLSGRCTQLAHDICGKRVIANHAMRDRVWPELVPRALRYWKLVGKPHEQLTDAEAEELNVLLEWSRKLGAEAVESAEKELAKTPPTSERGGE